MSDIKSKSFISSLRIRTKTKSYRPISLLPLLSKSKTSTHH